MSDTTPAAVPAERPQRHFLPIGILAIATLGLWFWTSRPVETLVPWQRDLAAAQEQARDQNRLILLEFDSLNCGYCKLMDGEVFSRPEVVPLLEDFIPVRLDMDRFQSEARRFGVRGVPAFYVLTPAGEVIDSREGAYSFQDFSRFLIAIQAEFRSNAT